MSSSRSDPMFGHELVFVKKAKSVVTAEKYNEFLSLLYNYHGRRIDIGVFKDGVLELFKEHEDLISRFNVFLPRGHEISVPLDGEHQGDVDALAVEDDEQQGDEDALAAKDEQKEDEEKQV
ncbi:uncharacterized protein LOC131648488 [Vicia villosa]|uniref:uncharacterized protein LOC131648488 n=1 Tax=Vicia villosa TaxID=3911 RepID=UPI00273B6054|nr:uncharacterized protein LOC131648488 [Vicia villosa]